MGFKTWRELYGTAMNCTQCGLCRTRKNVVFGEGNPQADIMFIGEGPGEVEDNTGRPFVGPAGRMLDELLADIDLKREDVYIANVIKCRPPGNRDPRPEEIQACMPYVRGQTAFVKPKVIVGLGRYASGLVLGRDVRMGREHGTVHQRKSMIIIPTYHPAALLHNPSTVPAAKEDFKVIREQVDALRDNRGTQ